MKAENETSNYDTVEGTELNESFDDLSQWVERKTIRCKETNMKQNKSLSQIRRKSGRKAKSNVLRQITNTIDSIEKETNRKDRPKKRKSQKKINEEIEEVCTRIDEFCFESDISDCTLIYLRKLKRESRNSAVKKQELAKMCTLLFSSKVEDLVFTSALADSLKFEDTSALIKVMNLDKDHVDEVPLPKRGRPLKDINTRKKMYDFWKEFSEISNDRRNGRHVIKKKASKVDIAISDLMDSDSVRAKEVKR